MLIKLFIFTFGIFLCSLSLTFIIIYMNLLNMGYSFFDYVNFIIRRPEILCVIPGAILTIIAVFKRKDRKI